MAPSLNVDNHKLMYHPKRVSEWQNNGDNFPIYVEIGPTNNCNHKCTFCALDYLENGSVYLDKNVMARNLEDMGQHGLKSIMFAGEGEPLLHKDIGYFTQKAKESGIDVSITSNGIPFGKHKREECLPNLSWIRFSIDSGSSENYAMVHGTNKDDFEKLMGNLEEAVKFRDKHNLGITIGTQFLMIPQNVGEAGKLAERLSGIGIDNLQIKPYSHHPHSLNNLVVDPSVYDSLEESLMRFNSSNFHVLFRGATKQRIETGRNYDVCNGLSFFSLIDATGNVTPCNMFYNNPEFTFGNINDNLFSDIWKSHKRKEVIQKINDQGISDCREGCRLDVINRYLGRLKNPESHDNFI